MSFGDTMDLVGEFGTSIFNMHLNDNLIHVS